MDMQDELIDRFGDIPKSVDNLLRVAELKAMAHRAYVTEVDINTQEIRIELYPKAKLDVTKIPALIAEYKTALRFAQGGEKPVLFYQDSWEAWGAGREQKIKAYGKNSALNIMRYFYR